MTVPVKIHTDMREHEWTNWDACTDVPLFSTGKFSVLA
jgi:hypothetical protein